MKLTREEKEWFVEEWRKSGRTKYAFAKEMGINIQTFINWIKKTETEKPFVEIKGVRERAGSLVENETRTTNEMVIEKGMIKIHLPTGVTGTDLALVVQVLG